MPIDGVSNILRPPRLGKIRLGKKIEGQRGPYPTATNYFVCPNEVQAVYGEKPTELKVMFPSDKWELVAPQWLKCYSYSQGMICRGDGITCRRKVDTETGDFANKDTKLWELVDGECHPENCPMIGSKQCRKVMSLSFILPDVPGLGVYQLDTSSFYSIVNLNSQLAPGGFLRQFTKDRIAFLPLVLSVGPQEVTPVGVGRKTVYVLSVRAVVKLSELIAASRKEPAQVLLPPAAEEEPPEDLYPDEVLEGAEEINTARSTTPKEGTGTAAPPSSTTQQTKPQQGTASAPPTGAIAHTPTPSEQESAKVWTEEIARKPNPAEERKAPQPAETLEEPLITAAQLKRLKELNDSYSIKLAPFIRLRKADVKAVNELTEKVAAEVIQDIEGSLKKKGIM